MNIGLVLAGGMAKGAYQIGALRALDRFIPRGEIKFVSAASIGVLNAYAYLTDNLDIAEEMWHRVCNEDSRLLITRVLRSSLLQQNIHSLCGGDKEISVPFFCSLLDLSHRKIVYKDLSKVRDGDVEKYLKACVAMPVYNRAVTVGRTAYFDGALADDIPIFPLMQYPVDYLVCMYFDDRFCRFENHYLDNKIVKLAFPTDGWLKKSLLFSRDSIDQMISDGYERTQFCLRSVLGDGYDDLKSVYRAIEIQNGQHKSEPFRVTVDVVASNLNRVSRHFVKRSIQ